MRKKLAGAALLCAAMLSLAACGGSNGGADSTAAPAGTEAAGADVTTPADTVTGAKVVRVAAVDPQVALDPQQYTYSIVMKITDNISEALFTTQSDGTVTPTLLTGMPEISEDQLTYTFELLPDVKFHNGEVLKSSDVKYSYERLIKLAKMGNLLQNVVGYEEMNSGAADELAGFEIIDDTHFTISLMRPLPLYYPPLTLLSILRRHVKRLAIPGGCRFFTVPVLSSWTATPPALEQLFPDLMIITAEQ